MKKRVLLLAVSCKNGGLCPGGLDMDNLQQWIRIVKDDGRAGAVQGYEIDFANPLDVIVFDGRPMPQGKQVENWVIDNNSCVNAGRMKLHGQIVPDRQVFDIAYRFYGYHGFWNNYRPYLNETEFNSITAPSESILKVTNVRIYKNDFGNAKIDFSWGNATFPLRFISMTDQDFYGRIDNGPVTFDNAYIVVSIPKSADDYIDPNTGEKKAYKFVSKVFGF